MHAEADLYLAFLDEPQNRHRAVFDELHLDVRMHAPVSREEIRQHALQNLWRGANPKDADASAAQRSRALAEGVDPDERVAAASEHVVARGGETHPAARAVEQPHAQLGLQVPDLPRQCRLRDVQPRRCAGEAFGLGNRDERSQVTESHVRFVSIAEQAGIGQHGSAIATLAANRPLMEDAMIRERWIVAAVTLAAARAAEAVGHADKTRVYYTQIVTLTR